MTKTPKRPARYENYAETHAAGARLRKAREAAGFGQAEASRRFGWNPNTYKKHEMGENGFDQTQARQYAKAYSVTPEFLLLGVGDETESIDKTADYSAASEFPAIPPRAGIEVKQIIAHNSRLGTGMHGATIDVPEYNTRAGAGSFGSEEAMTKIIEGNVDISTDLINDVWGIPEAFLRSLRGQLRAYPSAARLVEVIGDSMYDPSNPGALGSIMPGDRVIVDTMDKNPSPAGPFVLWDGLGIVVKTVEVVDFKPPIRLRLSSRNPRYNPYEVTAEEAHIMGRVRGRICEI